MYLSLASLGLVAANSRLHASFTFFVRNPNLVRLFQNFFQKFFLKFCQYFFQKFLPKSFTKLRHTASTMVSLVPGLGSRKFATQVVYLSLASLGLVAANSRLHASLTLCVFKIFQNFSLSMCVTKFFSKPCKSFPFFPKIFSKIFPKFFCKIFSKIFANIFFFAKILPNFFQKFFQKFFFKNFFQNFCQNFFQNFPIFFPKFLRKNFFFSKILPMIFFQNFFHKIFSQNFSNIFFKNFCQKFFQNCDTRLLQWYLFPGLQAAIRDSGCVLVACVFQNFGSRKFFFNFLSA